ncbi:MAG: hypothetical protein L0312_02445, partial [Acidobacteria bacterium]|nr:hypothetical protein [Acidobacteriota bacterium]
ESLLDEEIKTALLDNLDKIPDHAVMALMDSLEKEREAIASLASDLEFMGRRKDLEWDELEAQQRAAAEQVIEEYLGQKEKELAR